MKCALDVAYGEDKAVAAALLFKDWGDAQPQSQYAEAIQPVAPYEPGQFYKRELPCLQAVMNRLPDSLNIDHLIVDSYVWLDGGRKGLGGYLFDQVQPTPVIGVAKTRFRNAVNSRELLRGKSQNPLIISAAGMALDDAVARIKEMHGKYRIPTLLKQVDRLCRDALLEA